MVEKVLSENELQVLYGLVRFPDLNDRELSDRLELRMSTITAIKNRLKRKGFYKTIRIPMLNMLGCELLGINFSKLNLIAPNDAKVAACERLVKSFNDIFYSLMDEEKLLFISVLKNYTDAKANIEQFYQTFSEQNFLENDETRFVFFPFEQAKILNFFDFSHLLKQTFDIKIKNDTDPPLDITIERPKEVTLTKIEKRVLYGLTKYPDYLDNAVAKAIGVTRQSVAKMKKKFETKGILKTIRIPDMKKLGFELLTFLHFIYNPRSTMESRKQSISKILKEMPLVLVVSSNMEGVIVGMTRNYTECQRYLLRGMKGYKENNFLRDDPTIMIFPLDDIKVLTEHTYHAIVKNLFELDDD